MHGKKNFEGAKDFWGTVKRLIKFMGPWKWMFVLVFVFAIGSTIFQIVTPKVKGEATTEIYAGIKRGMAS
ncbi:MAG: ABC transporter ATP-binding protein, partial [Clostridia bacterium]|nr:ABC transporter ATP-binding protein [Clostridia bacterium]